MEKIPHYLEVTEAIKQKNGDIKFVTRKIDLWEEDLPKEAYFESDSIGLKIYLVASKSVFNEREKTHEKVPDSEVRIQFKGGHWRTRNSKMLELVMNSTAYRKGTARIDTTDPTRFWADMGFIETMTMPVIKEVKTSHPKFSDIDPSKLTETEEGAVPLGKIG